MKKISVLFFALIFVSTVVAQDRSVGNDKRIVPDVNYVAPQATNLTLKGVNFIGEEFIQTDFDYGGNNVIPKMISLADIDGTGNLDPFFVGMRRDNVAGIATHIAFGYSAFGAPIDVFRAFAPTQSLSWGTTQLCFGGVHDGQALVMALSGGESHHSWIDLVNLAPVEPFPQTTFGAGPPDFVYQADGTIWTLNTDAMIRKSTDDGATFTDVQLIGTGDANVNLSFGNGPIENPFYGNLTGQYMATVGGWGTMTVPDAEDGVYWYGSNDFGTTWNGSVIGLDGIYGQVANNPNLAPYFENFGQLNANIDETGTTHVVMNGYGEGINSVGDTVNTFPIVYWNSNAAEWLEISIPAIAFGPNETLATIRPGNGIGQSYPSVSVTDDGQFIFVIWTAPEYIGAIGSSAINIYPGDGSANSGQIFYTDLHWTVSTDGGSTWATPQKIGEPNVSETYANVARRLEIISNNDVKAHFVFFVDALPGTSLFNTTAPNQNSNALGTWRYLALNFGYDPFPEIPVTFQVDMSVQMFEGNFPPGANVVVRGDFQTDAGDPNGLWQGNMFQLSDTDDDSIYTGTFQIPSNFVGNNYIFKYVIVNPPAGDNWESINNRPFTLTSPETVIPLDCFNHDCPVVYNPVTNTIIFTADISGILGVGIGGAFDPNQDSLLVMGLDWGLDGWNVIGNRKLENADPFHPGIYTTTLMVTSFIGATGEGDSTEWIFRAFPGSRFEDLGWESNIDRWYVYGPDSITNSLPTIIPQIAPNFQVSTNPIDFTLNVDMTGAVNRHNGEPIPLDSIEFVIVTGTTQFLGSYYHNPSPCYCIDDTAFGYIKALTHISENIWSYHTTIPIGQHCGIFGYKFGVIYPGSDTISSGFNSLMNELPYGVYHNILLTGLQNTLVINNWFGYPVPPDNVEQIENLLPSDFILEQNYPNPFNPTTKIRYSITEYSSVSLKVFNLLGEEIETLFNGEQSAGVYEATFDASQLTSGVYFYTLKTDNFSSSKKMILIK